MISESDAAEFKSDVLDKIKITQGVQYGLIVLGALMIACVIILLVSQRICTKVSIFLWPHLPLSIRNVGQAWVLNSSSFETRSFFVLFYPIHFSLLLHFFMFFLLLFSAALSLIPPLSVFSHFLHSFLFLLICLYSLSHLSLSRSASFYLSFFLLSHPSVFSHTLLSVSLPLNVF